MTLVIKKLLSTNPNKERWFAITDTEILEYTSLECITSTHSNINLLVIINSSLIPYRIKHRISKYQEEIKHSSFPTVDIEQIVDKTFSELYSEAKYKNTSSIEDYILKRIQECNTKQ